MQSVDELALELESRREHLEERWCLPWYQDRQPEPIWSDPVVLSLDAYDDDALSQLATRLLKSTSHAIRGIALHFIAVRRLTGHHARVHEALADESLHLRALASVVIGALRDLEGLELLLETKDSEHPEVKKAIVDALRTIGDTRSIPLLARWVGRVGEDDELRLKACQALGSIGDDAAMPVLARVMEDDTVAPDVRSAATLAVGTIGGREAQQLLLNGLKKGRVEVRPLCVEALLPFRDASVMEALVAAVERDAAGEVRRLALRAVVELGGATAVHLARGALDDPDSEVRALACKALVSLDATPDATRRVAARLDDPEETVRAQALRSLARATGRDFGPKNGEPLEAALSRAREFAAATFPDQDDSGDVGASESSEAGC